MIMYTYMIDIQADLHTITTVAADKSFQKDRMWLNGEEVEINKRGQAVLREIRAIAGNRIDPKTGEVIVKKEDWNNYKVHISSLNTFPTGAGLASSAAGLACLTTTLAKLYSCQETFKGQLTAIARQGSGSASRSLAGGLVRWQKGRLSNARDSIAMQIADEKYWPEMRAIILVVSDKEKDTSSTSGMETSKNTSPFLKFRAENIVEARVAELETAYLKRDFETFGKLTMQDSNSFHATCQDTYPPIFYLNDVSKSIMRLVHVINDHCGRIVCAYTYDAGPNAVLYLLEKDTPMVMAIMSKYFPSFGQLNEYTNDVAFFQKCNGMDIDADLVEKLDKTGRKPIQGDVKYIFHTKSGSGPVQQDGDQCLLDPSTGLPVAADNAVYTRHKKMQIKPVPKAHNFGMLKCPFTWGLLIASAAVGVLGGMTLSKHLK